MEGEDRSRRTSVKDKALRVKDRAIEERRRVSESLLRRQRGAALNARRQQQLLKLQKDAEVDAPIIFTDEEMRVALQTAVQNIHASHGRPEHLRNVRYLRYLLTNGEDLPYTLLRQLDIVNLFLGELKAETPALQSESLWALAMLANGDLSSAQTLVAHASQFLPFLEGTAGFDVAELSAWLFRSLFSVTDVEEAMAGLDVAAPMAQLLFRCMDTDTSSDPHVMDASMTAAWSLCSLVAHSAVARERLLHVPQFTTRLSNLLTIQNDRIVTEAAWLMTYLAAADNAHLQALIHEQAVRQLVAVLVQTLKGEGRDLASVYGILTPVLRSLGNIAAGASKPQVQELLSSDDALILKCTSECLTSRHRGIQKEGCKALSNIAASSNLQALQALISSPVMEQVIHLVSHSAFDIKREAAFALANVCFNSDLPNLHFLQVFVSNSQDLVPGVVSLLRGVDVDTLRLGLDFTALILEHVPDSAQRVEEADGIDALDTLQFGDFPSELQDLASYLVDTYFGEDYGLD